MALWSLSAQLPAQISLECLLAVICSICWKCQSSAKHFVLSHIDNSDLVFKINSTLSYNTNGKHHVEKFQLTQKYVCRK